MFEMMLNPFRTGNMVWPNPSLVLPVTTIDYIRTDNPTEMYVSGGGTGNAIASRKLYHYNGVTNTWTDLGALPARVSSNGTNNVAFIDGNVVLMNGDQIDIYNVASKVWSTKPGPTYGTVYHASANGCVTYKGDAYFFGDSTNPAGSWMKKYVLATNTFSTEATYSTTTGHGTYSRGIVVNDVAYFFSTSGLVNQVVTYTFATKTFATIPTPHNITSRPSVSALGTDIFVAGSAPAGAPSNQIDGNRVLVFDTTTLAYRELWAVSPPKLPAMSLVVADKLLLYGGTTALSGGALSPNMQVIDLLAKGLYVPKSLVAMATPTMFKGGYLGTAAAVTDNYIYATPGQAFGAGPSTPEAFSRYVASSDTWQPLMAQPDPNSQATTLDIGTKLLFFGGTTVSGNALSVRSYTYATGVWATEATLTDVVGSLLNPSIARAGDWVVIAYGRERGSASGTMLKYNIVTKIMTRLPNMVSGGDPVDFGTVMSDGTNIYMHSATTYNAGVKHLNQFNRFNPVNNVFTPLAAPPINFYNMPVGYCSKGYFVVVGAVSPTGVDNTKRLTYTPATNKWQVYTVPSLENNIQKRSAVLKDKLYILGNSTNQTSYTLEL